MSFPLARCVSPRLLILAIGMCGKLGLALTLDDRMALYQNCTIFDKSDMYGGPVCGDNGVTYANSFYLDCKNHHSRETVATLHSGPCLENEEYCSVDLYYEPVCGSDQKIYTNMQSLLCVRHRHSRDLTAVPMTDCPQNDHCYRGGTKHYGMNPVCANNGHSYQNAAQLKCLQRYNPELQIVHDGGCHVEFVHQLYGQAVCDLAKGRYEWNPVCASDGVTYPNPFVFLCYRSHLKVISNGECDTHSHESCIQAHTNTTVLPNGEYVNDAFTTDDEVCGNDGRTYQSIHHLQCHTRHDKYVFLRHHGSCSGPDDYPCGSVPEEEHREPVCGTDGKSYVSPEALWCAKLRSPERGIAYRHDGPC
ncbi:PREDICTED: serine protease inhibitor dipetalogastin-like [Vollenhovia emeryi]|uniref:serine protease inhibitor dipetalogastin-like n=1 Tax=Vollenhovia emeryi TaxID=411798 RepID=UPI0005F45276|nr:PREDICTED: serine protease inhibitor dipetalogastin-like [Vollenhovia emeryi]